MLSYLSELIKSAFVGGIEGTKPEDIGILAAAYDAVTIARFI